jgi:CubicO group peptidase (beta-lactamase class C family)
MKKTILSLFFILNSFSLWAGPLVTISTQDELSSYISKQGFNGVALVAKDKNVLFKKAFGFKNLEAKIPLSTEDRFQIGSITKQFVAAALLKLQEEGKLSLDDDVTKYLPEFPQYHKIKIRNLLNHTGGIANYTDQKEFWRLLDYSKIMTMDDLIQFFVPYPLDFEVGTKWNYSNSGYILAGKILESVSQKKWNEFIQTNFFQPLEMNSSLVADYFEKYSAVEGHMLHEEGLRPFHDYNLSWAQSAGQIFSTVDDLLKWTSIYADSVLLTETSKREMQTPFLNDYALGIFSVPSLKDKLISHSGRTHGFVSNLDYFKNSKIAVITLDNIDGSAGFINTILYSFFKDGTTKAIKLENFPMSEENLREFVGSYESEKMTIEVFLKEGSLFLKPEGQRAYRMRPNDIDSFDLEQISGEEFLRDEKGNVIKLSHYQDGKTSTFIKVSIEDKSLSLYKGNGEIIAPKKRADQTDLKF